LHPTLQPSPEQIQEQLARILSTSAFSRSPSLVRFLKYLVERALAGEQESPKEYRLGLDVFDRSEDFDPKDDTIVRVQARNLRTRLDEYYNQASPSDTVRFVLPKGVYAIHFEAIEAPVATPVEIPVAPARRVPIHVPVRAISMAAIAVAIAIGLFAFVTRHSGGTHNPSPTLLVVPFANLSSDPDSEYFAGGLTEELIGALANLPGLRVMARSASLRFKDKPIDFADLRELGVSNVVEGSIRKTDKKVRISVRLIDLQNGSSLWSRDYDREIQDAITTEQEIANAVASTLRLQLTASVQPASPKVPNPDAYELYLKGLYYWRQIDPASAVKGIAYLERSIAIDPTFAPAYVALAGCYGSQIIYYAIPHPEGYAKVRELTLKALQIDDSLAEAHTLLAGTYAWNDWNWNRAELEYRGGAKLAPQSMIAHQYYASFLGSLGRQREAEAEMQIALRVDPLDSLLLWGEAQLMHWRGENREAETLLQKISNQDPAFGLTVRLQAEVYWAMGKYREAEAVLRGRLAKDPMDPLAQGELGYTLAKSGRTKESREILQQLRERAGKSAVPEQALAFVYLGLGEDDQAIDQLWKACESRMIRASLLKVSPVYAPLKSNARFVELLRHVNLEP
jgi:TolB-like protein